MWRGKYIRYAIKLFDLSYSQALNSPVMITTNKKSSSVRVSCRSFLLFLALFLLSPPIVALSPSVRHDETSSSDPLLQQTIDGVGLDFSDIWNSVTNNWFDSGTQPVQDLQSRPNTRYEIFQGSIHINTLSQLFKALSLEKSAFKLFP